MLRRDKVNGAPCFLKPIQIGDGRGRNIGERLAGEKSLVGRNQDIWEGAEPDKPLIGNWLS